MSHEVDGEMTAAEAMALLEIRSLMRTRGHGLLADTLSDAALIDMAAQGLGLARENLAAIFEATRERLLAVPAPEAYALAAVLAQDEKVTAELAAPEAAAIREKLRERFRVLGFRELAALNDLALLELAQFIVEGRDREKLPE